MLVASDEITDKDWPALSRAKGDVFMIVGATLYGFSTSSLPFCPVPCIKTDIYAPSSIANATEEFFVRRSPLYEVVGQLGMWGTLINGIQAAGLEHNDMKLASWNGATSAYLLYHLVSRVLETHRVHLQSAYSSPTRQQCLSCTLSRLSCTAWPPLRTTTSAC